MKTVITATFKQESNRYSPGVSNMELFEARIASLDPVGIISNNQNASTEMGAFIRTFQNEPEFDLRPVAEFNAAPGPVVGDDVWNLVAKTLLDAIDNTPSVDGLLLALHGAMVTQSTEDGEGDLLELLRKALGPNVPIICSLDLHANITEKMIRNANGFFPYDYYPHTDTFEAGIRAAECMKKTLRGEITPVTAFCKLPLLMPYVPTAHPVMEPIVRKNQSFRRQEKLINVNLCHGFFHADIYEQGAAVLVTADGDRELAQSLADELGAEIYEKRALLNRKYFTAQEAVKQGLAAKCSPVTLADVADNPGSGGSGDGMELIRVMLQEQVTDGVVALIYDPETVAQAKKAGVGACMEFELGGKLAPEYTDGPLKVQATVEALNDGRVLNTEGYLKGTYTRFGDLAVLRVQGIRIIVGSIRQQPVSLGIYQYCGIDPTAAKILVVKSAVHFREAYEKISPLILDTLTPALGPPTPDMLPLAHCRRPIYPLDDI